MCLVLYKPKKYSPGTTPSPWNLGSKWPTPPESWHVLPCSASAVRASKKVQLWQIGSHTRAFQRAINQGSTPPLTSSKWWSNTSICPLSYKFDNKGREVCCKVSLCKNCHRQSCSAINCLSIGINILAWGSSVPLISARKGTNAPIGSVCVPHTSPHSAAAAD